MIPQWFTSNYALRFLLPAFLLVASALLLGCYFETNDDLFMVFLLRGVGTLHPVSDLSLYFHGTASCISYLYQLLPALPWYGLILYTLLLVSLLLLFNVIDQACTRLSASQRVLLLTVFFAAAYLEHVLRMNFTRIPVLLTGATVLYSLQRLSYRSGWDWWWLVGCVLILLAWSIRPSGAFLGLAVVAPALLWLAPLRRGLLLTACCGGLLAAASLWQMSQRDMATQSYQRIDILKSNHKDYNLYSMNPRSAKDSVALESLDNWWGFNDTALVNTAFFQRTGSISSEHTVHNVLAPKAISLLTRLAGDYFFIFYLTAVLVVALLLLSKRRYRLWLWAYLLFMGGILAALGVGLQLPARVATPMLTLSTSVLVLYVLPRLEAPLPSINHSLRLVGLVVFGLLFGGYVLKNVLRAQRHRLEQKQCELYLARVGAYTGSRPLIYASLFVRSMSPFRNYNLGTGLSLTLNGWTAHDASQTEVLYSLTHTRNFRLAMSRLAARPDVVWLMPDGFESFFTRYLNAIELGAPSFCPVGPLLPKAGADLPLPHFAEVCSPTSAAQ